MSFDLVPPGSPPSPRPAPTPLASADPQAQGPAAVPTTPGDRSTAFQPVTGGPEMQSGEKLLVEAYAAIWVILFVLVLLSWRRQGKLEARITQLDGAIEKAREAEAKGAR